MRKLIDIEDKVLDKLRIKAKRSNRNLKNYIEKLLIDHANEINQ